MWQSRHGRSFLTLWLGENLLCRRIFGNQIVGQFAGRGAQMGKCTKSLIELESIVRASLHGAGTFVSTVANAPAQGSHGNWAFLHVDGECVVDPAIEELIRALQARYDLAW
jgi:hypothetical protein